MTAKFVPAWKDDKGNRMIFVAPNLLFDEIGDVIDYHFAEFIFFIPFGLKPDSHVEIDIDHDGHGEIPHRLGSLGALGECAIISGPMFDEAETTQAGE